MVHSGLTLVNPASGEQITFRPTAADTDGGPGDVVVVPPAFPTAANAGQVEALVRVDVRPALEMERLFEVAVSLAEEAGPRRAGFRSHPTSRSSHASSSRRCGPPFLPTGCSE